MQNIICLITLHPNKIWCDFLNSFRNYIVYVIVDYNKFKLTEFQKKYSNITFIQIENINCKLSGYTNMNFILKKEITGWEKALYYFNINLKAIDYNFVWL